jgi:transposase InsO family protein
MREDNLLAIRRRRFVVTTDADHTFRVWPNLAQYLELTDINQLWVADLTFLRLEEEFVYLAVVLDAYSRKVIGWALDRAMTGSLTVKALERALTSRRPSPGRSMHAWSTWICWSGAARY